MGIGLGRKAQVVIVSTRAYSGEYEDLTGPVLKNWLLELGFQTVELHLVPDGALVGQKLAEILALAPQVIITSGGTGLSPSDKTPEQTAAFIDTQIPGIMEAIRAKGLEKSSYAALSRGLAGLAGDTVIINLPGSMGAVEDSMAILGELLPHLIEQIRGGNHESGA